MSSTADSTTAPPPAESPPKNVYAAMNACMREIGHIGKNHRPSDGPRFNFRGVDDVYAALQPVFARNGVLAVPKVLESSYEEAKTAKGGLKTYCRLRVEYTFFGPDGSSIVAIVAGEAMDSSDKSTPKAMSIAYKYAMFQVLAIPCEEVNHDWDPDFEKQDRVPHDGGGQGNGNAAPEQLRAMNQLGEKLYGGRDAWQKATPAMVAWATGNATDIPAEMTADECERAINAMRAELDKKQPANAGGRN